MHRLNITGAYAVINFFKGAFMQKFIIMVLACSLFACMPPPPKDLMELAIEDPDLALVNNGTYHGTYGNIADATNRNAFICGVEVDILDHEYVDIRILSTETSKRVILLGEEKTDALFDSILESQSLSVDAVSGATATSKSILKSIENCFTP